MRVCEVLSVRVRHEIPGETGEVLEYKFRVQVP